MNIILTSVEPALADAWERFCGDLDFVTVHRGSIFDLSCDAVVSPANSFGFMDGGIDMLYTIQQHANSIRPFEAQVETPNRNSKKRRCTSQVFGLPSVQAVSHRLPGH